MSKPSEKVKIMIPYFWELFIRYQNNPNHFIQGSDILADQFGRGERNVKELIDSCNKHSDQHKLGVKFKYTRKLTYSQLLKQLNS